MRLKMCVRSLLQRNVQCQPTTASCCHVFVPQYGRLAAVFGTGVKSLRVSPKCTSHIIEKESCGLSASAEQTKFNVSNNFVIPLLSFLTCIVKCVCEGGEEGGVRVRCLLDRKV